METPMFKTIVAKLLAFALAIAPSLCCAPSWAADPLAPMAKEAADAAPKAVEEMKVWWKDHRKEIGDETRKKAGEVRGDLGDNSFKKAKKGETYRDNSEKKPLSAQLPVPPVNRHPNRACAGSASPQWSSPPPSSLPAPACRIAIGRASSLSA